MTLEHPLHPPSASNKSHARIHSLRPSPPFPADTKGGGISPESFRSPSSQSSEEDGILIPLWDLPLSSGVCGDVILGDESNAKLLGEGDWRSLCLWNAPTDGEEGSVSFGTKSRGRA
ncbi:hypothetical protein TNCT_549151 [Trichonephila clavata]|uniref:Uncharacterized protein n=1 Tax=Trichonephila clavata TaxID=2740835 RepID=A0A8X6G2N0_TRICU|nr:hypothetical protein TNCT_549151 [Trichonephila clavata]